MKHLMRDSKFKRVGVLSLAIWALGMAFVAANPLKVTRENTMRLYPSLSLYVNNKEGKDFNLNVDIRDVNMYARGAREVLFKVYDPDGRLLLRKVIEDDGVTEPIFQDRIAGWDHILQYHGHLELQGIKPHSWSAFSKPSRLNRIVPTTIRHRVNKAKKGVYRVLMTGAFDHYATVEIDQGLKYSVAGDHTWLHGNGTRLKTSYLYIPADVNKINFAISEIDTPRRRQFTLSAPDGTVLFDGKAKGGFAHIKGKDWEKITVDVKKQQGKCLKLEVSDAPNDFLVLVTFQHPGKSFPNQKVWGYIAPASMGLFSPDIETALATSGGSKVVDGKLFWHSFQERFHAWLAANPLDANAEQKKLRKDLEYLFSQFRLLAIGDCRGFNPWGNLAYYGSGYYSTRVYQTSWKLLKEGRMPGSLKPIVQEGLILAGDRLSFVADIGRTNGNSFAQINQALWYCSEATGDALQRKRFEIFFDRWANGGWGKGIGLSKSGDSQEIFSHAYHYGSYILDNWRGISWVKNSILKDAAHDPRWSKVMRRIENLYSYIYCRDGNVKGFAADTPASPWSSRTANKVHHHEKNWESPENTWKGMPGPDFNVNVNDGSEWFAARRKNYYMLTFHGSITPAVTSKTMAGQLGFSGGTICQLTVPGKGPVIYSTSSDYWYGMGRHPSNWRNFQLHSLVGHKWDGQPFVSAISEHEDAKLKGNVVKSSGLVRETNLKVTREYVYNDDHIVCKVKLDDADPVELMKIWSQKRKWSEVREAYEMIPFLPSKGKKVTRVLLESGAELTKKAVVTEMIDINRGDFGVKVKLDKPMSIALSEKSAVLIQVVDKETKAKDVSLEYRLYPYRSNYAAK